MLVNYGIKPWEIDRFSRKKLTLMLLYNKEQKTHNDNLKIIEDMKCQNQR